MDLDLLPVAALDCDPDGYVRRANGPAERLFAAGPGTLAGAALQRLFPRELALPERLTAAGEEVLTLHARRADRVPFTAEVRATAGAGGIVLVVSEVRDFARPTAGATPLEAAFEHMPVGQALYDTDGRFVRVNAALCALLDRAPGELLGQRDSELTHPDDRQSDIDAAWRILEGELDTWHTEKRFLRPDGSVVWALANLTFLRDEGRRPLCWIGQFQDITARKEAELELRHQADHDFLTGLVSRRRLLEVLGAELEAANAGASRGALLLLDLDGFKAVNDSRGHDAGDALLAHIATALRARVRLSDTVGRLGGDEFAVVLPGGDEGAARRVAEALREAVTDVDATVTASIGVALYHGLTAPAPDRLLAAADRAMYEAKRRGRDRVGLATG